MITYKVSKSRSAENLPLLLSNEDDELNIWKSIGTPSDREQTHEEWEVSSQSGSHKSIGIIGHDMAELTNCQGIIHIVKASIGTGVLALPSALRYSGLLLGSLAILILSIVSIYSMRLLLKVVAHLRQSSPQFINNLDYEKTVELCFKSSSERFRKYSWMSRVLYGSLVVAEVGFLSSYHIFVAENTKAIVEHYVNPTAYIMPLWIYQLIVAVFLAPLLFIKTLAKLSYFSQLANLLMVTSLTISLVYCLQDPLPIQSLPLIKISDATPLFFGIVIFSFESINLINPVESHLKMKKNILNPCGVLNIATSIVLFTYLIIGICGYWKFGDNIASSLIMSVPMEPWYYMLCKPFYVISILISYALQGYVLYNIVWTKLERKIYGEKWKKVGENCLRTGIVVMTTVLSIAIPHFDLFISLVGAFSGASLTLIFPAICNSVTVYSVKGNPHWRWQLGINFVVFIIGIIGCVVGTYSSIVNILKAVRK